jgi:phospholipid/cholesterol/gamma-HCH transport system substrate-binding protein
MTRLKTLLGRMRNTPGIARDVSMLLAMLLVGAVATAYLFSNYHVILPTTKTYEFAAEFDQAPAVQLASRQEVRIAGIAVGKITDAEVTDDGHARLKFKIDPKQAVYKNARVIMRSKTPLNVMYVTLDPGGPPAERLDPGGVIPISQTDRVLQPYELLDELDARARTALTDLVMHADAALADAPQDLPPGLGATDKAAASFQPVVTALQQRRTNLRHLVTSVAKIATAAGHDDIRLTRLVDALSGTLGVLAKNDKHLSQALGRLPGVTRTLRSSMASTAGLSAQLSPTLKALHRASGDLPETLDSLTDTVANAGDVLVEARPVARKLRPVVADLRPLVSDLNGTLADLSPVVSSLPGATARLVPWLDDLGAFIYNTSSSFSLGDVNGGLGRANLVVKLYDPLGGGPE